MNRSFQLAVAIASITALVASGTTGCVPLSSTRLIKNETPAGIIYYMPQRDIKIGVTVAAAGKITAITAGASPSYADHSQRYVLQNEGVGIGQRTADVSVTRDGLLSKANSKVVSNISDIVKSAAETTAILGRQRDAAEGNSECPAGTYEITVPVPDRPAEESGNTDNPIKNTSRAILCSLLIEITEISGTWPQPVPLAKVQKAEPGYYYRQDRPYRVTVKTASPETILLETIIGSPSNAPVQFIPVSRTFFADSSTDIGFDNGVLSTYKEVKDSEVAAAVKLPADFFGAYFEAVGKVFEAFKDSDEAEADALLYDLKLQIAKQKYAACVTAISAGDKTAITSLECNSQ